MDEDNKGRKGCSRSQNRLYQPLIKGRREEKDEPKKEGRELGILGRQK